MTTSPRRAASFTVTGVAPVSCARALRVSGPRELATNTLCPSAVKRRVSEPPMWPAPMMPMFISAPFQMNLTTESREEVIRRLRRQEQMQKAVSSNQKAGSRRQEADGTRQDVSTIRVSGWEQNSTGAGKRRHAEGVRLNSTLTGSMHLLVSCFRWRCHRLLNSSPAGTRHHAKLHVDAYSLGLPVRL